MQTDLRLFGLDLTHAWAQARQAALSLLGVVVKALSPEPAVQLIRDDAADSATAGARFRAIELPEHLLLRRSITLPQTTAAQVDAAIALDVQTHSPFLSEDALWVQHIQAQDHQLLAQWVLTSRPLVQTHLQQRQLDPQTIEVRVPFGQQHQLLRGFGEAARLRRIRRVMVINVVLVLATLAWLVAIAITPTLQLRLQAKQAEAALHQLTQSTQPVLQQRQRMLLTRDKALHMQQTLAQGVKTLPVIAALTQALPDETSLRSLRLQGSSALLNGQTPNAADLMKQLGGVPGMSQVRAPSAATRRVGAASEIFTIELDVQPPPQAPAAEAPQADKVPQPAPAATATTPAAGTPTTAQRQP